MRSIYPSNYTSALKSITTTRSKVMDKNNNRTAVMLFNSGPEAINLHLGETDSAPITLFANRGMYFPEPLLNELWAMTGSGTANLTVWEA